MPNVGDTIKVLVQSVKESFAIVEYKGVSATLVDIELTYEVGKVPKVSDFVSVGETHAVKVTAVKGEKFSVSLKQAKENPWLDPPKIGKEYYARISMVTDYGYFVKLEWFCLGLLLNENAKAKHSLGEKISVVITECDVKKERVFLNEL